MQAREPREVQIVSMEFIFHKHKHRHILLSVLLFTGIFHFPMESFLLLFIVHESSGVSQGSREDTFILHNAISNSVCAFQAGQFSFA